MQDTIRFQLQQSAQVMARLADSATEAIAQAGALMIETIQQGGKVLFCGNGGSAADAQHLAAELVGRYLKNRQGLAAIALTTDTSILTAVANDLGYDQVFRRQVEALGRPGDCLVGISTSGRSPNVVAALQEAKARKMHTIVMVGDGPSPMADLADVALRVPSQDTPRIQEAHGLMGHILCDLVERACAKPEV